MKLLTKDIRRKIPKLYTQDGMGEKAIVHVKFFHPYSSWKWYATEGEPVLDDNNVEIDFRFFGWVGGNFPELGYFCLSELESVKLAGLGMERDLYFKPIPLKEIEGYS